MHFFAELFADEFEEDGSERWQLDVRAERAILPGRFFGVNLSGVADVSAAPHFGIRIENLLPTSANRKADAVRRSGNRREVKCAENGGTVRIATDKGNDGIVRVIAGNPFKSFGA